MKRLNRRTQMVILTAVMAALLAAVYILGIVIPDEAVAESFLNAKLPPSREHFLERTRLDGIFLCAR